MPVHFDGADDYLAGFGFTGAGTSVVIEWEITPRAVDNKTHLLSDGQVSIGVLSDGRVEINGEHINYAYTQSAAGVIAVDTPYTIRYQAEVGVGASILVNGVAVITFSAGQVNGDLWLDSLQMFTVIGQSGNRFEGDVDRITIIRDGVTAWEIDNQPASVWNASPQMVGAVTDVGGSSGATGTGAGTLGLTGAGQGRARATATAAGAVGLGGTGAGATRARGQGSGSVPLSGSATGTVASAALAWTDIAATNNAALPYTIWGKDWRANVAVTAYDLMSWDGDDQVVKARVQTGDVRAGDPADRYRSELSGSPFAWSAADGDRWIAFAQVPLGLPSDVTFTTLMQQFDIGFANPMLKLDDRGDLLQVNIAGNPGTTRAQVAAWEGTRLELGRLYNHVWRVRAHGGGQGELDWWVNGTLVLTLRGVALGSGASPSAYEKVGVYVDDDATLGLDSDAEVILLNYESASGPDALQARIASPLAVPAAIASLYPTGAAPTGTTLITGSVTGTGAGSLALSGAGQGTSTAQGAGSGSTPLTGSGSGASPSRGTGSGSLGLTGTGQGVTPSQGTGAGSIGLGAAAQGAAEAQGAGQGSLGLAGFGAGAAPAQGQGSGDLGLSGAGQGTAPAQATGAGSLPLAGQGQGATAAQGSGAGTMPLAGAGSGAVVAAGSAIGQGSGTLGLAGSGQGAAPAGGDGVGSMPLEGDATGGAAASGAGSGSLGLTGQGEGDAPAGGQAAGALGLSGAGTGRSPVAGQGEGALTVSGAARGHVITPGDPIAAFVALGTWRAFAANATSAPPLEAEGTWTSFTATGTFGL